jgi:hypothetical protein
MTAPSTIVVVMITVAAVGAAFGLEGSLHHLYKIHSEAIEHLLDHVVGPNAENLVSGKCRFPRCQPRRIS